MTPATLFRTVLFGVFITNAACAAPDPDTYKARDWSKQYPLEYYSSLGSADDLDDLGDPNFGYGHGSQAKYMIKSIEKANKSGGLNATCFSCKTARFNDMYTVYGDEVFSGQKSTKYSAMLSPLDFWSCETCHADMTKPAATAGAQLITTKIFGKELFNKLPPKSAVCAQCHNNLAPWSDSRIIPSVIAIKEKKTAYRYGWEPEGLIKATLEDAQPEGVRYPEGKTYEMTKYAHAKTDKKLGIYLIANGNHADAEVYMDSVHYKLNVGCADCHMPIVEDKTGTRYRSHDSSKSALNSKASMQYCLGCHTSDKVKTVKDMVAYVRNAQKSVAEKDAAVAKKQDETFDLLKVAIEGKKLDEKAINEAKFKYAVAAYYKEFVYGNRGATPGEKVAHNPEKNRRYLEKALSVLDEAQTILKN